MLHPFVTVIPCPHARAFRVFCACHLSPLCWAMIKQFSFFSHSTTCKTKAIAGASERTRKWERIKLTMEKETMVINEKRLSACWWCWWCFTIFSIRIFCCLVCIFCRNLLAMLRASTFVCYNIFFALVLVFCKMLLLLLLLLPVADSSFSFNFSTRKSINVLNFDCEPFQVVCLLSGSLSNALEKVLRFPWKLKWTQLRIGWDHDSQAFDLRLQFTLFHFKFHFVSFYLVHLNIFFHVHK